jgi:cytochrome c oxidase cbb3-type subunit 3
MRRLLACAALVLASACQREARTYHDEPPSGMRPDGVRSTPFVAGGAQSPLSNENPYQGNAYGISEGKRLYSAMNCVGCHAHGGGAIGPALMDGKWIYGGEPAQIYATIVQGRPDGMPSYGGKLPDQQVWQIVAYVQSLSARVPRDSATSRDDDMSVMKPELRLERRPAIQTGHR